MQTTNTTPFPALDLAKNNWNFLKIWVDSMQSPPYLLMLLGVESGHCQIFDPAEQDKRIKRCENYGQAQLWLLEDEYEPFADRLSEVELS